MESWPAGSPDFNCIENSHGGVGRLTGLKDEGTSTIPKTIYPRTQRRESEVLEMRQDKRLYGSRCGNWNFNMSRSLISDVNNPPSCEMMRFTNRHGSISLSWWILQTTGHKLNTEPAIARTISVIGASDKVVWYYFSLGVAVLNTERRRLTVYLPVSDMSFPRWSTHVRSGSYQRYKIGLSVRDEDQSAVSLVARLLSLLFVPSVARLVVRSINRASGSKGGDRRPSVCRVYLQFGGNIDGIQ